MRVVVVTDWRPGLFGLWLLAGVVLSRLRLA